MSPSVVANASNRVPDQVGTEAGVAVQAEGVDQPDRY
jgi:hypothetical protein